MPESWEHAGFTDRRLYQARQETGDRLFAQPALPALRFSCVPNQCTPETCLKGENFCEKSESMFASLID